MGGVGGLRGGAAPPLAPCPRRRRPKRQTKTKPPRPQGNQPPVKAAFYSMPFAQRPPRLPAELPAAQRPPRRRRPKRQTKTKPPRPQGNQPPVKTAFYSMPFAQRPPPPSGGTPSRAAAPSPEAAQIACKGKTRRARRATKSQNKSRLPFCGYRIEMPYLAPSARSSKAMNS